MLSVSGPLASDRRPNRATVSLALLALGNVSVHLGRRRVLRDITLDARPGARFRPVASAAELQSGQHLGPPLPKAPTILSAFQRGIWDMIANRGGASAVLTNRLGPHT
jgi:hypothetical protein